MDLELLKTFTCLLQTRSFTKTAKIIGRSQSAVSQQISKLEDFFGKKLLNRSNNLSLTHEGKILYSKASEILALWNDMHDKISTPDLSGEIHFGVPEDFVSVLLSDVLSEFVQLHPMIRLRIDCDLTRILYKRFEKGEFDTVLVKLGRADDFPEGIPVWSEELCWIGKKDFRCPGETDFLPLILAPEPCVYRERALQALIASNRKHKIVFTSPSYAGSIAAVKAGLGVTVYPHNMIPEDEEIVFRKDLPQMRDIHVSIFQRKSENPIIQSFSDFLLKKASKYQKG